MRPLTAILAGSQAVGEAVREGGATVVVATWERARGHRRIPAAQLEAEDLRLLGIDLDNI